MKRVIWLALFLCSQANSQVFVNKEKAEICYNNVCEPILYGRNTPSGTFQMRLARIDSPGYGGTVLAFKDLGNGEWVSVHRVFTSRPEQRRLEKLHGPVNGRKTVSMGCINVDSKVYEKLVECCSNATLVIK